MNEITCYIVDDQQKGIRALTSLIKLVPELKLVGSTTDPYVALHQLTSGEIVADITFVDIEMPKISGIDLAGLIMGVTKVVFVTAYDNFAAQAFEADVAIDFIVKPVSLERFVKGVDKVRLRLETQPTNPTKTITNDHFFIKMEGKGRYHKIMFNDIIYIEGAVNFMKVHLTDRFHLAHMTMLAMEEILLDKDFFRIHKSFLINLNQIQGIDGNTIEMSNGDKLDIGPVYRKSFFERMEPYLPKGKK